MIVISKKLYSSNFSPTLIVPNSHRQHVIFILTQKIAQLHESHEKLGCYHMDLILNPKQKWVVATKKKRFKVHRKLTQIQLTQCKVRSLIAARLFHHCMLNSLLQYCIHFQTTSLSLTMWNTGTLCFKESMHCVQILPR